VQARSQVLAYIEGKFHTAGISFCVFGRLAAEKYGCPLVAHHDNILQLAVEDSKVELLAEMLNDEELRLVTKTRWAGTRVHGVFLESIEGESQVELLPAYFACSFPKAVFDRVVTFEGDPSPFPSLADLLVSLHHALLEPNQEFIGKSFASMLCTDSSPVGLWPGVSLGPSNWRRIGAWNRETALGVLPNQANRLGSPQVTHGTPF